MNDIFGINSNERFYDDNINDDEMLDGANDYYDEIDHDEEKEDDEEKELSDEEGEETRYHLSFACDDCDYRWDDIIVGNKEKIEREEFDLACPMCGSTAITQI
ncbi:MAG: hypothetical protein JXN64_15530 [Spirochaetes bacterium]|nr:hypothetical protein [Spirochaetota bacterium]